MAKRFIPAAPRSYGGYDPEVASNEAGSVPEGVSLTVQSDAIDADINTIVRRFGITGAMPTDIDLSKFVDLTDMPVDYRTAVEFSRAAAGEFNRMPADVRSQFDNDPQKFMDFVHATDGDGKPVNRAALVKLGIVLEPSVPAPVLVKMADLPKTDPPK